MSLDEKEEPPMNYQCPHCKGIFKSDLTTTLVSLKDKEIKALKTQVLKLRMVIANIRKLVLEAT